MAQHEIRKARKARLAKAIVRTAHVFAKRLVKSGMTDYKTEFFYVLSHYACYCSDHIYRAIYY